MKKNVGILVAALVWVSIAILCVICPARHLYTLRGEIYIVSYEENTTIIRDENGQVWSLHGTEVPVRGTPIILTMDSMGTNTIVDDSIIKFEVAR